MRAINRKILLLYGIVAFLILSLALLCALCVDKSVTASASSPQKFSPQMNSVYTHYLDGAVDWQQKNQCSAWGIKHSEAGGVTYAQVYMQKSSGTTGNISPAGDYGIGLRYQDIVITIFAGDLKHSISLYDGSGTLIKHETENDSINVTLDQGKYQFFVIMETGTWKRKSDGKMEKYRLEAEFTFYIDQTSPYIIGTYPEGGEKWVGINHVVEAKDDLSGVDDFYYIEFDRKSGEIVFKTVEREENLIRYPINIFPEYIDDSFLTGKSIYFKTSSLHFAKMFINFIIEKLLDEKETDIWTNYILNYSNFIIRLLNFYIVAKCKYYKDHHSDQITLQLVTAIRKLKDLLSPIILVLHRNKKLPSTNVSWTLRDDGNVWESKSHSNYLIYKDRVTYNISLKNCKDILKSRNTIHMISDIIDSLKKSVKRASKSESYIG